MIAMIFIAALVGVIYLFPPEMLLECRHTGITLYWMSQKPRFLKLKIEECFRNLL